MRPERQKIPDQTLFEKPGSARRPGNRVNPLALSFSPFPQSPGDRIRDLGSSASLRGAQRANAEPEFFASADLRALHLIALRQKTGVVATTMAAHCLRSHQRPPLTEQAAFQAEQPDAG